MPCMADSESEPSGTAHWRVREPKDRDAGRRGAMALAAAEGRCGQCMAPGLLSERLGA